MRYYIWIGKRNGVVKNALIAFSDKKLFSLKAYIHYGERTLVAGRGL